MKERNETKPAIRGNVVRASGAHKDLGLRVPSHSDGALPRIGLAEGAINRLVSLTDRIGAMTSHAEVQLDRLLSASLDERGVGSASIAEGQMNMVHFQLTQLEYVVDGLQAQLRRIEDL